MELHQSISRAIKEFGKDIITEPRFVNILADYDAFSETRVPKTVIRDMVEGGFTKKIVNLNSDTQFVEIITNGLAYEALNLFPYREDLIHTVVAAFVYGITGIDVCLNKADDDSFIETEEWVSNPLTDFVVSDDGKTLIEGKENLSGVVIIPKGIEIIGRAAFAWNLQITEVHFPEGVLEIESNAFKRCAKLEKVCFSNSITRIDNGAFGNCESLEEIDLPSGLLYLGDNVFEDCTMLEYIYINDKLEEVGNNPFECACTCSRNNQHFCSDNGSLYSKDMKLLYRVPSDTEQYTMPDTVLTIKRRAISKCKKLRSVTFSKILKKIEPYGISDNPWITELQFPSSLREICNYAIWYNNNLKKFNIPAELKKLGAFYCSGIQRIYCESCNPDKIQVSQKALNDNYDRSCTLYVPVGTYEMYVNDALFGHFNRITEFNYNFSNKSSCNKHITLSDILPIRDVYLGYTSVKEMKMKEKFDKNLMYSEDDNKIRFGYEFGSNFYDVCNSGFLTEFHSSYYNDDCIEILNKLDIDVSFSYNRIKNILKTHGFGVKEKFAPYEDTDMFLAAFTATSFDKSFSIDFGFSDSNEKCSGNTIDSAYTLYNIEIKAQEIHDFLLSNDEKEVIKAKAELSGKVIIPQGIESIAHGVFSNCKKITEVVFPERLKSIGGSAFYGCTNLASVTFPSSLTLSSGASPIFSIISIGMDAFSGCESLRRFFIPQHIRIINGWQFFEGPIDVDPSNSEYMSIDGSVFSKDGKVLYHVPCDIESYEVPHGVEEIQGAFYKNRNLKHLLLPNTLKVIGKYAFAWCSSLNSFNIPESVTIIGEHAFHWCSSLNSFNIPESVTIIGEHAFHWCSSLGSIHVPNSVKTIDVSTFENSTLEELILSEGLQVIESCAFFQAYVSGDLVIPDSITEIGTLAFEYTMAKRLIFHSLNPKQIRFKDKPDFTGFSAIYVPREAIDKYKRLKVFKELNINPY